MLLSSGADATCLCRFNKDQSAKEAPQISEMSDTAVSSLTANGLLFPASLFCSFFCGDPPGTRSPAPMPRTDMQLFKAALQKEKLSGQATRQTKLNQLYVGAEPTRVGRSGTPGPHCRITHV